MTLDRKALKQTCLNMTGAVEEFPFGAEVSVFKVMGKMFALLPVDADPITISLKCDPIEATMLRQQYNGVEAGYHLNKKHWNTVSANSDVPSDQILEMIEDSYILVRQKLTKKARAELEALENS